MDIQTLAKEHSIVRDVASPDFFEGTLMSNGGLGVVVYTRPDAIVLHLGHTDTLVLFPNWDLTKPAAFRSLRTKGAFLVAAACENGEVAYVCVTAEAGGTVRLKNPWQIAAIDNGPVCSDETVCGPLAAGKAFV